MATSQSATVGLGCGTYLDVMARICRRRILPVARMPAESPSRVFDVNREPPTTAELSQSRVRCGRRPQDTASDMSAAWNRMLRANIASSRRWWTAIKRPHTKTMHQRMTVPISNRPRSSSSHRLQVSAYRLATVGRRSFPVAASILWNSLPPDIQSSSSLTDFCHRLKTYLFHKSFLQTFCCNYPHIRLCFRGLFNDSCYSSHIKNSDLND